jgi:hypothetical protein
MALLLDDMVYTTPGANDFLYGTSVHFNVFDPLFFYGDSGTIGFLVLCSRHGRVGFSLPSSRWQET